MHLSRFHIIHPTSPPVDPTMVRSSFRGMTTGKAIKKWASSVRNSAALGKSLRSHPAFADIVKFVQRHPKISTVTDVFVDQPVWDGSHKSTKCFFAVDADGKATSLSQTYCISPHLYAKHQTNKVMQCKEAARGEITKHTLEFKKKAFRGRETLVCPLDATPITFHTSHIDHVYPFKNILRDWLTEEGLAPEDVKTTTRAVSVGRVFVDRELAARWFAFHHTKAQYRATSVHGNIVTARLLSKQRQRPRPTVAELAAAARARAAAAQAAACSAAAVSHKHHRAGL
jgi:hypothetical protein